MTTQFVNRRKVDDNSFKAAIKKRVPEEREKRNRSLQYTEALLWKTVKKIRLHFTKNLMTRPYQTGTIPVFHIRGIDAMVSGAKQVLALGINRSGTRGNKPHATPFPFRTHKYHNSIA